MLSYRDMAPWLSAHSAPACGEKVVAPATKGGNVFPRPQGGCMVLAAKGGIKKWRPKGRRTSPAQRYYIPPEGGSTQPACKASADHRQNPGSPGPKGPAAGSTLTPVRACQPSGILESTAPHQSRSRSRPRRRRLNPQASKGLVFPSMTPRSLYPPAPRSSSLAASLARSSMA